MDSGRTVYGEIEIALHRSQPEAYEIELRVTDPETQGEIAPARGIAAISFDELLLQQNNAAAYGQALAAQLFSDSTVKDLYGRTLASFESRGVMIRFRLSIAPSAPELHGLRWELLRDPNTNTLLATSERLVFSRFMLSRDWRVVRLRPKRELKALIAVGAPADVSAVYNLAPVDEEGEIARAQTALTGIRTAVAGRGEPLTLARLLDAMREGVDIVYLVCHGVLPRSKEPALFLEDEAGNTARVMAGELAARIAELPEPPRLIVLASCESAGREEAASAVNVDSAHAALAPRLAEAGVSAVIAMQGKVSMETVRLGMPVFFRELVKDGQIDRALAVARGAVRDRPDFWMPALFLRLKAGRIWYEPGFGGDSKEEFRKWSSICARVRKGEFIPVLGPELGEELFGGTRELASELAKKSPCPLAPHERRDLAKVAQFLAATQDRKFAQEQIEKQFRLQIAKRLGHGNGDAERPLPELLDLALGKERAEEDNPYRILADLPAAIYVNASPETFLYRSLKAAGKNPEAVFSSWRGKDIPRQPQPKVPTPTPDAPWVYHVFGVFGRPDTLVITEDDFFDYLIAASRLDLLLQAVVGRMMESSLLFLGFPLDDWRFRVLFRMIVTRQGTERMKDVSHVGVQVNPDEYSFSDMEGARTYIESYFQTAKDGPQISIFWGSAADFLKQLRKKLEETGAEEPAPAAQEAGDDWL
jgi:hypothetical protein